MKSQRVGFAFCGSFCTHGVVLKELENLCREYGTVLPIVSQVCQTTDTRFGKAKDFLARVEELTGHTVISSIREAEPVGPKKLLDVLVIAPCTGNTLAKLAAGITDTPVTMAAKAHLRNDRPVVIAVATNDGLSAAARNIGELLVRKNYYFVPLGIDKLSSTCGKKLNIQLECDFSVRINPDFPY
ncbi:MAG: dipicolinate synthase subunit B [Oscillospiraceae bacterium]|nr:dipicolinate synthase subunit B [Oscillospiraceae bacterium]